MLVELKPVIVWFPGLMVKLSVAAALVPEPLVAVTVTEEDPADVGVPEITPLPVFKLNPAGKLPLAIA